MQAERIPDVFGFEVGRGRGDAAQRADQDIGHCIPRHFGAGSFQDWALLGVHLAIGVLW